MEEVGIAMDRQQAEAAEQRKSAIVAMRASEEAVIDTRCDGSQISEDEHLDLAAKELEHQKEGLRAQQERLQEQRVELVKRHASPAARRSSSPLASSLATARRELETSGDHVEDALERIRRSNNVWRATSPQAAGGR